MRPLPSDSTTATVPVSAIPKFAPEIATPTVRNLSRRWRRAASAIPVASQPRSSPWAIVRSNRRLISARFLWMAGTRMCDDCSPASWMISSARSVSIASMPWAASASLSPISSVAIDLTLITSRGWVGRASPAMPATIAFASAASRAQWTTPPARCTDASSRSSCSGSVAIVRALIAEPAARSASQSSSSAIVASRLARIVVVALPRFRRSCASCRVSCAAAGNPFIPGPPGSPPGGRSALRPAAAAARPRCASGTSCRPTCRPPRACRAGAAACRRASPSTCPRS